MDAPVGQPPSPLLTSKGHTVEWFGLVRLKLDEACECWGEEKGDTGNPG